MARGKMVELAMSMLDIEVVGNGVFVTPHGGTQEDGLYVVSSEELAELADILESHEHSGDEMWACTAWDEWCGNGEPLKKWEG
jgi:hypothetical protein